MKPTRSITWQSDQFKRALFLNATVAAMRGKHAVLRKFYIKARFGGNRVFEGHRAHPGHTYSRLRSPGPMIRNGAKNKPAGTAAERKIAASHQKLVLQNPAPASPGIGFSYDAARWRLSGQNERSGMRIVSPGCTAVALDSRTARSAASFSPRTYANFWLARYVKPPAFAISA